MTADPLSEFPVIKILIVDDRPENLLALQAALSDCGYKVIEANSGSEALEHVKHHDFACVLMDVQMPFMDGFETARFMRRESRSRSTPIIFATAIHRTEEYEQLGYLSGAVDYLFKPINTTILRAKVSVFVELFLQAEEIRRKNILLERAIEKAKENEQLKVALASRDEFLSMASHELKTPITPLSLQLETFIKLFESGATAAMIEPTRLLRMLKTSQGQVERLSRLISELLDVSKLTSQKLELNKSRFDLVKLTNKVITEYAEEIEKLGCRLTVNAEGELFGEWDAFRIEQVLINLLTNSMKYGCGKPIEIHLGSTAAGAVFSITDHGVGIAKEDHDRIFKRFERAVSGSNFSGLGLGLYISQQIVYLHKGLIRVESEKDEGARFIVELPL